MEREKRDVARESEQREKPEKGEACKEMRSEKSPPAKSKVPIYDYKGHLDRGHDIRLQLVF